MSQQVHYFVSMPFYPKNNVQPWCRTRSKPNLNIIFVLIIVTDAQVFETVKKYGGQACYHNCTTFTKPIRLLMSSKIQNLARHFLSTNEKSLNKQEIEKYIQKKWRNNRLQSILCLHIWAKCCMLANQPERLSLFLVTSSSCTGHSSCTRSMKF